jgi:hypothetical protein
VSIRRRQQNEIKIPALSPPKERKDKDGAPSHGANMPADNCGSAWHKLLAR